MSKSGHHGHGKPFQHLVVTILFLVSVFKHELFEKVLNISSDKLIPSLVLFLVFIFVYYLFEQLSEESVKGGFGQHFVVSVLLLISIFKHEIFEDAFKDHGRHVVFNLVLFLVFLGVYFLFQKIGEKSVGLSSVQLFRRLFVGPDDITGVWIDVVVDAHKIIKGGAFIIINKDSDGFKVVGKEYFCLGGKGIDFRSIGSFYHEKRLSFFYHEDEIELGNSHYGESLYVFSGEERCNHLRGCFVRESSVEINHNVGQRLSTSLRPIYKNDKKRLKNVSGDVVRYYKKSLIRPILRLIRLHRRPEITPEDEAILTVEVMRHIARHCGFTMEGDCSNLTKKTA